MESIRDLFSLQGIISVIDLLKRDKNRKRVIFDEEMVHEERYHAVKNKLLLYLQQERGDEKERQINELLAIVLPNLNYGVDKALVFFLRLCHFRYLGSEDLTIVDPCFREEIYANFQTHLLLSLMGKDMKLDTQDVIVIGCLFKLARILWSNAGVCKSKVNHTTNNQTSISELQSKVESTTTDQSVSEFPSNTGFSISNNKLINYMGLFYPIFNNRETFPNLKLEFSYNQLYNIGQKALEVTSFDQEIEINENTIQQQMFYYLNLIITVMSFEFKQISRSIENYCPLIIEGQSYSTTPDLIVKMSNSELKRIFPFECKNGSIDGYISSFSAEEPLSSKSYYFTHLFSQLLREAICCSSSGGFIFGVDSIYYIQFYEVVHSDMIFRAKEIVSGIHSQMFHLKTGLDIIKCLYWAFNRAETDLKEKAISTSYARNGIVSIFVPYYYEKMSSIYLTIEDEIEDAMDDESQMRASEVDSNNSFSNPSILGRFEMVELNDRQIRMICKLAKFFQPQWKIQKFQDILQTYEVNIIQGRSYAFNSAVLRLTNRKSREMSILKIIDPVFSKMSEGKRRNLDVCFQNAITQFFKEAYAYHFLKDESFVPLVYNIGIINNDNHSYQEVVDILNPSLSGFYIHMSFIDGKCLKQLNAKEKEKCEPQLFECLEQMHRRNIFHCDITDSNIIVDKNGKVVFIDHGMTKIYKKRLHVKGYKSDSSITIQQKAKADWEALSRALGINISTIYNVVGYPEANIDNQAEDCGVVDDDFAEPDEDEDSQIVVNASFNNQLTTIPEYLESQFTQGSTSDAKQ